MSSYRSIEFQRTANTVLTVCVSQGDNPSWYAPRGQKRAIYRYTAFDSPHRGGVSRKLDKEGLAPAVLVVVPVGRVSKESS
jgi:hypothetical protein